MRGAAAGSALAATRERVGGAEVLGRAPSPAQRCPPLGLRQEKGARKNEDEGQL